MRSSPTSRSAFLSITSALLLSASGGCGGNDCGPNGASPNALELGNGDIKINYGGLHAGPNNDCPDPSAPDGVISLTISGLQADGGDGAVNFCIGRPDLLNAGTDLALGVDVAGSEVKITDLTGADSDCTYEFDDTRPPTGGVHADGICDAGANPAGFALVVDGAVSIHRTCAGTTDQIELQLSGLVAVSSDRAQ